MSDLALVGINVGAWFVIQAGSGYLVHRIPLDRLADDGWLFRTRRIERDGDLYRHTLRIGRWKRWLPEAGAVFAGGFDKRRLRSFDRANLERYVIETRRAELGHWLAALPTPLFALWNPWPATVLMFVYAAAVNGPCVASQRYNRIRLQRLLARRR